MNPINLKTSKHKFLNWRISCQHWAVKKSAVVKLLMHPRKFYTPQLKITRGFRWSARDVAAKHWNIAVNKKRLEKVRKNWVLWSRNHRSFWPGHQRLCYKCVSPLWPQRDSRITRSCNVCHEITMAATLMIRCTSGSGLKSVVVEVGIWGWRNEAWMYREAMTYLHKLHFI